MAVAVPMTSCMSEPIIAISTISQRMILGTKGYLSWQISAKCFPETTPSRAESRCIIPPSTVAQSKTHKSLYSAMAPDCKSDSILPGSRYAMLTGKKDEKTP